MSLFETFVSQSGCTCCHAVLSNAQGINTSFVTALGHSRQLSIYKPTTDYPAIMGPTAVLVNSYRNLLRLARGQIVALAL